MNQPTAAKIIDFINRLEVRDPTSSIYDAMKDKPASEISPYNWAEMADLSIQASTYIPGEPLQLQRGRIGEFAFCRRAMDALRGDSQVRKQVGEYLMKRAIEIEKEREDLA